MTIALESLVIVLIGFLDLASTLFWVHHHGAQEANPLFSRYLAMGTFWFVASKIVMLLGPVFLLEWARRRRPLFTRWASRFAIAAYLALYAVGLARLNPQLLRPGEMNPSIAMLNPSGYGIAWAESGTARSTWQPDPAMIPGLMRHYEQTRRKGMLRADDSAR